MVPSIRSRSRRGIFRKSDSRPKEHAKGARSRAGLIVDSAGQVPVELLGRLLIHDDLRKLERMLLKKNRKK
jgi:hypothetical protein